MDNNHDQEVAMEIIAYAGQGRSQAFEALKKARAGEFEEADKLMIASKESIAQAHDVQTKMLVDEANGHQTPFSILTVHAQDHFMTGMLASELINELITMYKERGNKQ